MLFSSSVRAEVAPVVARVPNAKAWTGQRVPFYVELRARGSFGGTASFDLPQIPGALVIKIGEPVVGSQELEGETWFVQTHEFALFAQKAGPLEVPALPVRFARREGYTGPATEVRAQTTSLMLEIQRPPGSEQIGFLITTESLAVSETWEPIPGPAEVGAIFKRTIVQRAEQLPGMALAPIPTKAPDGIRIYPGVAETKDDLYRGEFLGERRETITYLLQKPGMFELPGLTYVWWNPKTQTLQSNTLPAVTFEVAAPLATAATNEAGVARHAWPWLLAVALAFGISAWQRRRLAILLTRYWKRLNPPDRVAARNLLRACRRHDAAAAELAWIVWRNTRDVGFLPNPELHAAVLGMQRHLFGPARSNSWRGDELAGALGKALAAIKARPTHARPCILPLLNHR